MTVFKTFWKVIIKYNTLSEKTKMMFEGECYMRVEDMILVTETGAEFLTTFDRDLFEFNND